MAINPYALCPCGSGKKIKFCCGDLAGEMEREDTPAGVRVRARVPAGAAARFERFSVNGQREPNGQPE